MKRETKSYEINMFSRTKQDYKNIPSFRGQDFELAKAMNRESKIERRGEGFEPKRNG